MDTTNFNSLEKTKAQSFEELFEQHGALAFEKQFLLSEVIGENHWQFDMNAGCISFGQELVFPVQVIGSLSFGDNSWMWGWANTQSGIPENLLEQSNALKALGEKLNIQELTEAHFAVGDNFEHKIGMIASGLFGASSYYLANYGKGTLVVTIQSDQIPDVNYNYPEKIFTTFPQLIGSIDINHREAFKNYLIDRGFQLKTDAHSIEGLKDGKTVRAEFDEQGRLTHLSN
ncbi:DUF6882 domain-containing protein [Rapidithrix thailandica]|uniref:DUF6882 domain-containing protein n=1 Tax=Rapidithrix thailandica TaxID=413964 RepID=A0AAW9SIJ4_9BACT